MCSFREAVSFFFGEKNRYQVGRGHGLMINSHHIGSLTQLKHPQLSPHRRTLSTSPPRHPRGSSVKARVPKFSGEMVAQVLEGGRCVAYVLEMM